jgi:hypothetical protein
MSLRNITLEDSDESSGLKDQAEEDRNALGYKLGILCDIPGKCGEALQALGLWTPAESWTQSLRGQEEICEGEQEYV